ncbi:hypothetical protein B0H12DRAFT_1177792 [Mycena haematopus]|nr:hypothetical protein B0H12DRAFT_1177792 [Mycena haematopus]
MRDLNLSNSSWFDLYSASDWKTLQVTTIFEVNKHYPALIRLRPSLLEDIPLENCPNIDSFLVQQPRKRTGSAFVSPPKKIARTLAISAPAETRQLSPPPQPMPGTAGQSYLRAFTPAPTIPNSSFAPVSTTPNPSLVPLPTIPHASASTAHLNTSQPHFPESFSIAEHARAWERYEEQQKRRTMGREKMWPQLFPGSKYVRTTARIWHQFYREAPRAIRDHFIGLDAAGSWEDFHAVVAAYKKDHRLPAFLTEPVVNTAAITAPSPPVNPSINSDTLHVSTPISDTLHISHISTPIAAAATQPELQQHPAERLETPIQPRNNLYGLCNVCDQPYDVSPSAKLLQLHEQLLPISIPSPNSINPAHRIVHSATRSAAYCKQHNTDVTLMPAARANGWPEHINFAILTDRTEKLISELQEIVEDVSSSSFFMLETEFKKGTAYFGEIGYGVIQRVIRQKFPAETIPDDYDYSPLTWDQVIEQVLIPEALTSLIAEDLHLDLEDAIAVIQDSTPFGLAYHSAPDDRDRSAAKFREDDDDLLAPFPAPSPLNSPRSPPPQLTLRTTPTPTPPPVDPASLCNYCDQEFPSEPSTVLLAMGKKLFSRSWPKPLPENPHHRALPEITMSVDHCKRHQFERDEMPTALRRGWPLKPSFARLFHRILDLGVALRALVYKRADSSQFFLAARQYYGNEVSKRSSLSAQYHSNRTSKHGTGYYGERGYQIIYPTLRFMFPDSPELLAVFHPLTYDIIIREILIPEATIRLIQVDLDVGAEDAIPVLKESHNFGLVLHPADDDCEFYARAMTCIADSHRRAGWALRVYEASDSNLPFESWLQEQKAVEEAAKVKVEPREMTLGGGRGEVIDLTNDDD